MPLSDSRGLRQELTRFLLVGGVAVAIDAALYWLLVRSADWDPSWAKRTSFAAGAVWAFFANKLFTFGRAEWRVGEPLLFAAVYAAGFVANAVVHDVVYRVTPAGAIAFLAATAASTITNFAGSKWIVFAPRAPRVS